MLGPLGSSGPRSPGILLLGMDFMSSDVTQIPFLLLKRESCLCCMLGQGSEGAGVDLTAAQVPLLCGCASNRRVL